MSSRRGKKEDFGQLIFKINRIAYKMRGMGYLLSQERMDDMAIDSEQYRQGIGFVLLDMADDLLDFSAKVEFWEVDRKKSNFSDSDPP